MAAFRKMQGLGNDFVVFDARRRPVALDAAAARAVADRRRGVGCDQVILIEPPRTADTAAWMTILNADGSPAQACGNAARCVADLLMREMGVGSVAIGSAGGVLRAARTAAGLVTVDMGIPRFGWAEIPLARPADTLRMPIGRDGVAEPAACSMGNPHATFFVADPDALDLATLGPAFETDPLFPERANVGFARILAPDRMRLRVWERGAGLTPACGSGACAAVVNAHRRGLAGRAVRVLLDGGALDILWAEDGRVLMTGPAAESFCGEIDLAALAA